MRGQQNSKIRGKKLIKLVKTLNTRLRAGYTLNAALKLCSESLSDKATLTVLKKLSHKLNTENMAIDAALSQMKRHFPPIFISMISIGSKTGSLKQSLTLLEQYLKSEAVIKEKMGQAVIYPIFVMVIMAIAAVVFAAVVIPAITAAALELNTGGNASLSSVLSNLHLLTVTLNAGFAVTAAAISGHFIALNRSRTYKAVCHRLMVEGPLLKQTAGLRYYWQIAFSLENLLLAGLTLEKALSETAEYLPNMYLKHQLNAVRSRMLHHSVPPQQAFAQSSFPPDFAYCMAEAAATGNAAESFGRLKNDYQSDFEDNLERVKKMIDPVFTCLIGGILVIFIALIIIPLFNAFSTIITV